MQDIISACWHDDPKERPTAKQLVQVLRSMEGDVQVGPSYPSSLDTLC